MRQRVEVGAVEHAVAVHVRVDHRANAPARQASSTASAGLLRRSVQPAAETRPSADVDGHDHALAVGGQHVVEELGVA